MSWLHYTQFIQSPSFLSPSVNKGKPFANWKLIECCLKTNKNYNDKILKQQGKLVKIHL